VRLGIILRTVCQRHSCDGQELRLNQIQTIGTHKFLFVWTAAAGDSVDDPIGVCLTRADCVGLFNSPADSTAIGELKHPAIGVGLFYADPRAVVCPIRSVHESLPENAQRERGPTFQCRCGDGGSRDGKVLRHSPGFVLRRQTVPTFVRALRSDSSVVAIESDALPILILVWKLKGVGAWAGVGQTGCRF